MAGRYRMTSARRVALRKAQLASAAKRRLRRASQGHITRRPRKRLTAAQKVKRNKRIILGTTAAVLVYSGARVAHNDYKIFKTDRYATHNRNLMGDVLNKKYHRSPKKGIRRAYAADRGKLAGRRIKSEAKVAGAIGRAPYTFSKGFYQGVQSSKVKRKRTAYNMRVGGVGSKHVVGLRVPQAALPVGRGSDQKRRRHHY